MGRFDCIGRFGMKVFLGMRWNYFIRFGIEIYLSLVSVCLLNIMAAWSHESFADAFNAYLSLGSLILLLLMHAAIVPMILIHDFKDEEGLTDLWRTTWADLDVSKPLSRYYNFFLLSR